MSYLNGFLCRETLDVRIIQKEIVLKNNSKKEIALENHEEAPYKIVWAILKQK